MLTYIQINAAKPRAKAWALSDSQGLYLAIQPAGSKLWRFRYRFLDRQKTLHLGRTGSAGGSAVTELVQQSYRLSQPLRWPSTVRAIADRLHRFLKAFGPTPNLE